MTEERRRANALPGEDMSSEKLAAFTDALLGGEAMDERERPPLAETVELLARALEPEKPPERLRRSILRQIRAQWEREHGAKDRSQRESLIERLLEPLQGLGRSRRRLIWTAAVALLMAAVGVALLLPEDMGGTTGTAVGGPGMTALVAVLALVGVVAVVVWIVKRET